MRIEDLKEKERRFVVYGFLSGLPGLLILYLAGTQEFIDAFAWILPYGITEESLGIGSGLLGMIMTIGGILIVRSRYLPKCPSCNVVFDGGKIGIVIATKNCPSCGENVVPQST